MTTSRELEGIQREGGTPYPTWGWERGQGCFPREVMLEEALASLSGHGSRREWEPLGANPQ